MQKIYVLLRNDQQTGPYSLEEIIRFDLKPYDLIWIQGKSAGWYYPQEISALHPYLPFVQQVQKAPVSPKPLESTGRTDVVSNGKEAHVKAANMSPDFTPGNKPVSTNLEAEIVAQFTTTPRPEAPAEKHPAGPLKQKPRHAPYVWGVSMLLLGGIMVTLWSPNHSSGENASAPQTSTAPISPVPENTSATVAPNEVTTIPTRVNLPVQKTASRSNVSAPEKTVLAGSATKEITSNRMAKVSDELATEPLPPDDASRQGESTQPVPATHEKTIPEEKKKLREKLFDLFRKPPGSETSSAKREAGDKESPGLAKLVHVRFDVPHDWMMGINGAKATLVNRNSQTIEKATVEIQYFDDDNVLLQKKVITFGKTEGKGDRTLSVPNHSTATRLEYVILSVEGKPAA